MILFYTFAGIQHDKEKFFIDTATVDIVSLDEFHDQRAAYCAFQNDATGR